MIILSKVGPAEKAEMVAMRALNHEIGEIADHLNVSRNTVARHLQKLREKAGSPDGCEEVVVRTLARGMIEQQSAEEMMQSFVILTD